MELSTAINKARKVYATINIAGCGVSIQISKPIARKAVDEFLTYEMAENGNFYDGWDNTDYHSIGYYDQQDNNLYIG